MQVGHDLRPHQGQAVRTLAWIVRNPAQGGNVASYEYDPTNGASGAVACPQIP